MSWRRTGSSALYLTVSGFAQAAFQWVMLALVARLDGSVRVGEFALAQAYVVPAGYFAWLSLRQRLFSNRHTNATYADYTFLRLTFPLACYSVIIALLFLIYPEPRFRLLIVAVFALKFADGFYDLSYGFLQREGRIRAIALRSVGRLILSLAVFMPAYFVTRNLWLSTFILVGAWTISIVAVDYRRFAEPAPTDPAAAAPSRASSRRLALIYSSLPLAVSGVVMSLNSSVPRYFLGGYTGPADLGYFAATFHFVAVGSLAITAVGQALLPRFSEAFSQRNQHHFWMPLAVTLLALELISLFGLGIAHLIGAVLLGFVYGPDFAASTGYLSAAALVAGPLYGVSIVGVAAFAVINSRDLLAGYIVGLVATVGSCALLIPYYGTYGAYAAIGLASVIQIAFFIFVLLICWRRNLGASVLVPAQADG